MRFERHHEPSCRFTDSSSGWPGAPSSVWAWSRCRWPSGCSATIGSSRFRDRRIRECLDDPLGHGAAGRARDHRGKAVCRVARCSAVSRSWRSPASSSRRRSIDSFITSTPIPVIAKGSDPA